MPADLKIPELGESISEVQIGEWHKAENDSVANGENLVTIESEKASLDLAAPAAGRLAKILKQKGDMAKVGEVIAQIQEGESESADLKDKDSRNPTTERPAARKSESAGHPMQQTTSGLAQGEIQPPKRDAPRSHEPIPDPSLSPHTPEGEGRGEEVPSSHEPRERVSLAEPPPASAEPSGIPREEEIVPMSPLRRTAARRLLEAQQNAALLTTFNEADMSAIIKLRKELGGAFAQKHGCKLGFMSFFVKASIDALKHVPQINAEARENNIVFRNYFDIGIAISSGRGLVVPVLRNAERLSFAEIETAIANLAQKADAGQLMPAELSGGTFTISNGGVFGSLLSTPIVNPPQSGVLGMHAIQERPIAVGGEVVIRPMMYLALTYDHRIVDGREAVTFLKRIKEAVETPARMLLEI